MLFKTKKPTFEHLKKKWTARHKSLQQNLFDKHTELSRQVALSGLSGLLLLTTPATLLLPQANLFTQNQIEKEKDTNAALAEKLKASVPEDVRSLTPEEEQKISDLLSAQFGMEVRASIDGKRLNRTYGLIGGEQHLYRFPGDTLYKHTDNASEWAMYGPAGIAPGLGAWGYFAPSEVALREKDKQREDYYLAVQTFLSPGQSVVVDIADAGPAQWTGKHLGGSPEVMHFLGLAQGPRKGAVLYFFIDDPNDTIPLGPLRISERLAKK
ncbi:MAG: Uncharacterized protein G01um101493_420 [Microgenomates group bacterium Gr01-1014_93]|nr:MAG: Uncharacterized protein G01um101493_420 [Microgenomates group bacterium Gr01-1014_93]